MKLNLGCGRDYRNGWVNVDVRRNIFTDVVHDLDVLPYPFKDNTFDEVLLSHILEHIKDPISTLKEIIRISKSRARIIVKVPHAHSYAQISDLQHKNSFSEHSFSKKHLREYEIDELVLVKRIFEFPSNRWKKYLPGKSLLKIFFNGIYDDLYFEFKVRKN